MATAYIISDYGKLGKHDDTLVFTNKDGERVVIFPYKTEMLVLVGRVSISADALCLLARHKIQPVLVSKKGEFNGKLVFGEGKNVFLRQKQYNLLSDGKASLEVARSIVTGKIRNSLSFIQRIKRNRNENDEEATARIDEAVSALKKCLSDAEKALSVDSLRGYEGMAGRAYFSVFALNIMSEWAEFPKRSKNPPETNVNAVLSFLYTLLSYRVNAAVEAQGLDACCGNLHALDYGSTALVFDLMEEFRAAVCDSVCCSLFNLGVLHEDEFRQEDEAVLLSSEGLKKVIAAFEEKMKSEVLYAPLKQKISYTKIIFEQANQYKRFVGGEETCYKPYYFK